LSISKPKTRDFQIRIAIARAPDQTASTKQSALLSLFQKFFKLVNTNPSQQGFKPLISIRNRPPPGSIVPMKRIFFLPLLVACGLQCFATNVKIITPSVPNGTVNTGYWAAIQASGGCTPYSWAVTSGSLPPGVSAKVNGQTTSLTLSGTPTKAVTDSFSVKVTGCGKISAQASYKITIQSGAYHVVNLDWNASTSKDVVGYNVYRSADATNWKRVNLSLIGPTLYSDSTVASKSTYYYSATAVDVNGKESVKTSTVKAIIP
jgi:hypothetical protein